MAILRFNAKNTKNIFQSNIKALCIKQNKATKTPFFRNIKEQLNEQKHHQNTLKRTLVLDLF
ncbi:hypothetical protein [Helicobacter pylori]|uniref:hypothetical protein n=1 Tax=Helicobacter pylori TaxID=210 RepID=UPI0005394AE6|nr:hypothetical protein [Helicobacter pylori]